MELDLLVNAFSDLLFSSFLFFSPSAIKGSRGWVGLEVEVGWRVGGGNAGSVTFI